VRRLAEGAGSQFDPKVVEVALRVLERPTQEQEPSSADAPDDS